MPTVKKILRTTILLVLLFAIFLTITSVALSFIYSDKIARITIEQLNNQLNAEIKINGDIYLSLIKDFPYTSISFEEMSIGSSLENDTVPLLTADRFALLFNWLDILKKKYIIENIIVEGATIYIHQNTDGVKNYLILQSDSSSLTDTTSFAFSIRNAELNNCELTWHDEKSGFFCSSSIHHLSIGLSFRKNAWHTTLKADGSITGLKVNEQDLLGETPLDLNLEANVKNEENNLQIESSKLSAGFCEINIAGSVALQSELSRMNLLLNGTIEDMEEIIAFLPGEYQRWLPPGMQGRIIFHSQIQNANNKSKPTVTTHFELVNGKLASPDHRFRTILINSKGKWEFPLDNISGSIVDIDTLTLNINGEQCGIKGYIHGFRSPDFKAQIRGIFPLDFANIWIARKDSIAYAGFIEVNNGLIEIGKSDSWTPSDLLASLKEFTLDVDSVNCTISHAGQPTMITSGRLTADMQKIAIEQLLITNPAMKGKINGTIMDCMPLLHGLVQKKNTHGGVSRVHLRMDMDYVNIQERDNDNSSGIEFTPVNAFLRLEGNLDLTCKSLRIYQFESKECRALASLKPGLMQLNHITLKYGDGLAGANGILRFTTDDISLEGKIHVSRIDIQQLFKDWGNFGQDFITSGNLSGILDGSTTIRCDWHKGAFKPGDLFADANLTITDGKLHHFEPLKELSEYIAVDEISEIEFGTLSNRILIQDKKIIIPAMEVKSNLITLEVEGEHTFDNQIDYWVTLNMKEALAAKFRKNTRHPEKIEESTAKGAIKLFINMKGEANNPVISFSKRKSGNLKNTTPLKNKKLKSGTDDHYWQYGEPEYIEWD